MYTYTYNIQEFNTEQLIDEVRIQLNKKLMSDYVGEIVDGSFLSDGTDVAFTFFSDLTQQEINTLNDLVTNYVYNPNYVASNFFKINKSLVDPSNIDYDIMGFNKKRTIINGELRTVEYYNNCTLTETGLTYSDLVVLESRTYTRDSGETALILYRDLSVDWYLYDNTVGMTKDYKKYYCPTEAISEGIAMRTNVILDAKVCALDALGVLYSFDLLNSVKLEIDLYTQGYKSPLVDGISGSTKPYLTQELKDNLVAILNY